LLCAEQPDAVAESLKRSAMPPAPLAEDAATVVPMQMSSTRRRFGYARRPGMT
jgi:hypothetical protein